MKWDKHNHSFNVDEIENLYPFEREIFVNLNINTLNINQGQHNDRTT